LLLLTEIFEDVMGYIMPKRNTRRNKPIDEQNSGLDEMAQVTTALGVSY